MGFKLDDTGRDEEVFEFLMGIEEVVVDNGAVDE